MADTKLVNGIRVPLTKKEQIEHDARMKEYREPIPRSEEELLYLEDPLIRFLIKNLTKLTGVDEQTLIYQYRQELETPLEKVQIPKTLTSSSKLKR